MADLTPAEKALAELAESLEVSTDCDHLFVPEAPVLLACPQCELQLVVEAVRPHIAAETLREAADHLAVAVYDLDTAGHVSRLLHHRADEIEREARDE